MCEVRYAVLWLLIVVTGTLYMLLKLHPGVVDTRFEDGVGEGVKGHCDCVVGMDLGTEYSSVAAYINGTLVHIPNEYGNVKTPSYVYFNDNGEPVVGDEAKARVTTKPNNVVFHAMRFLGRKFKDSFIKNQKKFYPFNIIPGPQKGVRLSLRVGEGGEFFTPEEIVALIIWKLKVVAENYMKKPVDCAVLSVPAMFLQTQRHAVKGAAMIAGIRVQRILNTPSVTAAGYVSAGSGEPSRWGEKEMLVYYLGAGACEVSIVTLTSGCVEVAATNGSRDTGLCDKQDMVVVTVVMVAPPILLPARSVDVTSVNSKEVMRAVDLVHRAMTHFMLSRANGSVIKKSPMLVQRLRREIERAVLQFSIILTPSVNITVESPAGEIVLQEELRLRTFVELCEEILDKTWKHIKSMLAFAKESQIKVKDILLLGGGVRIIGVQEAIRKYFPQLNVIQGEVTAGENKALGVAAYAAVLTKEMTSPIILDVTSYAIGVTLKLKNVTVFRQFSPLLVQTVKQYTAGEDHQDTASATFYEGDVPGENLLMFELNMHGGSKRRSKGDVMLEVNYQLSADGLLEVYAKELFGNQKSTIFLEPKNVLQGEDMKRLINRWEEWLLPKGREYSRRWFAEDMYSRCLYDSLYVFDTGPGGEDSERISAYLRAERRWYSRSEYLDAVNFDDRRRHLLNMLIERLDDDDIEQFQIICDHTGESACPESVEC